MVVYYDLIFLLNFIYQFGILAVTNRILHIGASTLRMMSGAAAGCVVYILTVTTLSRYPVFFFLLSVISNSLISVVIYRIRHIRQFIRVFLLQITACICLAGMLDLLCRYIGNSYLMLTGAGAVVFLWLLVKTVRDMMAERMAGRHMIVPVLLKCGRKEYHTTGLIDSGNSLFDPVSGKPVCIMPQSIFCRIFPEKEVCMQKGYCVIPYRSVGKKKGVMEAFYVDAVEISGNETETYTHILFAVSPESFGKNAGYEIILHPKAVDEPVENGRLQKRI